MNNNNFFDFLVATDQLDDFLGYKVNNELEENSNGDSNDMCDELQMSNFNENENVDGEED